MRALIVSLALAVVVVICMAFVVFFAGLHVSSAMLASVGFGIFMVAALFAAVAALGPKARPTPLLTPTIAGTCAAALATVIVIVGSTQFGQAHRTAMRAGEPAKVTAPAQNVAAAPVENKSQAASEPEPIQFPGVTIVPVGPLPGLASDPLNVDVAPAATPEPSAPEPTAQATPMEPAAPSDIAKAPTRAADPEPIDLPTDTDLQEPAKTSAPSASPTASSIPIPPIPTPSPKRLVLSEDVFDTSKPPVLRQRIDGVSPPLPRSRPCGAGGPSCP